MEQVKQAQTVFVVTSLLCLQRQLFNTIAYTNINACIIQKLLAKMDSAESFCAETRVLIIHMKRVISIFHVDVADWIGSIIWWGDFSNLCSPTPYRNKIKDKPVHSMQYAWSDNCGWVKIMDFQINNYILSKIQSTFTVVFALIFVSLSTSVF